MMMYLKNIAFAALLACTGAAWGMEQTTQSTTPDATLLFTINNPTTPEDRKKLADSFKQQGLNCTICLEDQKDDQPKQPWIVSCCKQTTHLACLVKHLKEKPTCLICNKNTCMLPDEAKKQISKEDQLLLMQNNVLAWDEEANSAYWREMFDPNKSGFMCALSEILAAEATRFILFISLNQFQSYNPRINLMNISTIFYSGAIELMITLNLNSNQFSIPNNRRQSAIFHQTMEYYQLVNASLCIYALAKSMT